MKLLATLAVATLAQDDFANYEVDRNFDYGSFGDYGLGDFDSAYDLGANYDSAYGSFYDYDAAAEAENDAEEDDERKGERYFFTNPAVTVTTTTTTTTTLHDGDHCWKCDQMTMSDCSTEGRMEKCQKGDKDCCFVEIREQHQKLQQLCTGCKDKVACENLRDENFHVLSNTNTNEKVMQCRPDYRQQYVGKFAGIQSVCRQCFMTCDPAENNGQYCFGGHNTGTSHQVLKTLLKTNEAEFPWNNYYKQTDASSGTNDARGIPIANIAGNLGGADWTSRTNLYSDDGTNGRTTVPGANSVVYWGLQGANRAWWSSDLKSIANNVRINGDAAANFDP